MPVWGILGNLGYRGVAALLVSLLPAEAKRHPRLATYATPFWHVVSAIAEFFAGVLLFYWGFLRYVRGFYLGPGWLYLTAPPSPAIPGSGQRFPAFVGLVGYLSFLFTPFAWLCLYAVVEGVVRALEVAFHGALPGSGPVVLAYKLGQKLRNRVSSRVLEKRLGPPRPDAVASRGHGGLEIVSRSHYPWEPGRVVEVEGELFVVVRVEPVLDGPWLSFRHVLRPLEPGEVIRGQVIRYTGGGEPQDL
ncbi:MAG: hypothetical protein ACP5NF_05015 [Thermoanaerobaculum sp.]